MLNIGGNAGKIYLGSNEIGKAYLGVTEVYSSSDDRFIFTVKTDNAGTSANNQFTIPTSTTGITTPFNYDIETSDGYTATGITGDHTITFPSGVGTHTVFITGDIPYIRFNGGNDSNKMLEISNWGRYGIGSTDQRRAFRGCLNLNIIATDEGRFENVELFGGGRFDGAFQSVRSTITFPKINVSSALDFGYCWDGVISMENFPANFFDNCLATDFLLAFWNTNLTTQSIDNILVSIESNGTSNGVFSQSGGQAPSATGEAAIDSLVGKGWTITVTGGYTP